MIAVDTSAIIATVVDEPMGPACSAILVANPLLISAATLTEALIVGSRPAFGTGVSALLDDFEFEIVEVDEAFARHAAEVYRRWGKGNHPARLNYGDCFSYALAELYDCPLLYVGDDFAQTHIRNALA